MSISISLSSDDLNSFSEVRYLVQDSVLDLRVVSGSRDLVSFPLNALGIFACDNEVSTKREGRSSFSSSGTDVSSSSLLGNDNVVGSDSIDHLKKLDSKDTLVSLLNISSLLFGLIIHNECN